jgi:hypothetical protein
VAAGSPRPGGHQAGKERKGDAPWAAPAPAPVRHVNPAPPPAGRRRLHGCRSSIHACSTGPIRLVPIPARIIQAPTARQAGRPSAHRAARHTAGRVFAAVRCADTTPPGNAQPKPGETGSVRWCSQAGHLHGEPGLEWDWHQPRQSPAHRQNHSHRSGRGGGDADGGNAGIRHRLPRAPSTSAPVLKAS